MTEADGLVERVARALVDAEAESGLLDPEDPREEWVANYVHLARAALKAIEEEGWMCVPIQATGMMLEMGAHFYAKTECGLMDGDRDEIAALENAWDAMLGEVHRVG